MSNTDSERIFRLAGTDWVRVPGSFDTLRSWPGGDLLMTEDTVRRLDRQLWDEADRTHARSA